MPIEYRVEVQPLAYEYRKLRIGNYLVFFRSSKEDEVVAVAQVLYGRRSLDRYLE